MHARHAVFIIRRRNGLFGTTMHVCHSNIEQSALLSSVQNHQSARRRNSIGGRKNVDKLVLIGFYGH